jgi:2-hydroxychromene-2-carboxylate isomerase
MSAPSLDFWFDFASTYSYPAAARIGPLAAEAGVGVRFRPFLLGPIFKAQGWASSPFNLYPAKGRNMWRDLERSCGLAASIPASRSLSAEQPARGPRGARGARPDVGRRFLPCALFCAEFADGCRIDDAAAIGNILAKLKIDPQPALAAAQSDDIKTRLRAQTDEAQRLGLFGAPSFTTADGELFWGNDRLEPALRWATGAR